MITEKIERKLRNALTVAELIELLQIMPQEAKVVFTCDYGDYSYTRQALPIKQGDELDGVLKESAYSQSGLSIQNPDEGADEIEAGYTVVVLS